MNVRLFKKTDDGNVRVGSPEQADLMSVAKAEHTLEQAKFIANHLQFRGEVRESDSGKSWYAWKVGFDEYAPTYKVDTSAIDGYPA